MQQAGLDELSARVGALELVTHSILARVFRRDPEFAAIMQAIAVDPVDEDEKFSDPGMHDRSVMFRIAIRDAVEAAREISDGWRAMDARR